MRRPGGDDGNALVEFVFLAVVLMVPLVYGMLGVFDTQRASFGATEAARQAGRTWVTSGCDQARATQAATLALADQHTTLEHIAFDPCPTLGGAGVVTVSTFVRLRGLDAFLPADRGGFSVTATFVAVRDRFVTTAAP